MYKKIIVPLDGSELAECVLPHVEDLAKGCGTDEVVLVSVTERIIGTTSRVGYTHSAEPLSPLQPITRVPVAIGKKQRQAERYLNRTANKLREKGLKVKTEVLLGNPAQEIVEYVANNNCDLIAIASHGRSGLSRWAFGSVTDKILRASPVPALVVRAPGNVPGR